MVDPQPAVFRVRADYASALLVGLATLAIYVFTLRPDVGGFEDAPKFQFVGYVLGTAHQPGYPLYVVLTHLFDLIPIGTIAYRVNLFSAVLAAVACVGSFVLARQLGASNLPATAGVFALSAGARFWRSAVVAEVYSLAAALVVFVIVCLIAWSRSGRLAFFYAACGLFAAGFGNHLTIVGILPAAIVYVVARDRSILRPRTVATAALIGTLGIAQYGYVVWRTIEKAPYVDAHATSFSDLGGLLTGSDFKDARFQYSARELMGQRLPALARTLASELATAGVLCFLCGVAATARQRDRSHLALVGGAAAGMLAIVLNMNGDDAGFVTPAMVLLWPIGALGLQLTVDLTRPLGRPLAATAAAGAVVVPLIAVTSNVDQANQRYQTADSEAFRAFYGQLPPRAAVVSEEYWTDMMMLYLQFTGEAGSTRDVTVIPQTADAVRTAAAEGRPVFAFQNAASWLGANGLAFAPAPVIGSPLAEWLRRLPRQSIVAVASSGRPLPIEAFPPRLRAAAAASRRRPFGVLVGRTDGRDVQLRESDQAATLRAAIGGGRQLDLNADERGSLIREDAARIAHISGGVTVAVFTRDGRLHRSFDIEPEAMLNVPIELRTFRLERATPCIELPRGAPVDVTPIVRYGGWLMTTPTMGKDLVDVTLVGDEPVSIRHHVVAGDGHASVEQSGINRVTWTIDHTGYRRPVFSLSIGAAVRSATATLQAGSHASSVWVCARAPAPLISTNSPSARLFAQTDDLFGGGWHEAEGANDMPFRWASRRSTLMLPIDVPSTVELRLNVTAAAAGATSIVAAANGRRVGECRLPSGQGTPCRWRIPSGDLIPGVNYVTLTADRSVIPAAAGSSADRRELAFSMSGGELRAAR